MVFLFFAVSIGFSLAAYYSYFKNIQNEVVNPNRWSWLIWSGSVLVETMTYDEVSGDLIKSAAFWISACCCIGITLRIWSISSWHRPDFTELLSVLISFIAIICWVKFKLVTLGHFIALVGLPIAFIPTWKNAWVDYKSENCASWKLWTIGDGLWFLVILLRLEKAEEIPYIVTEGLCHGSVWLLVVLRRKNASASA
jgi:hypothetical protein